jgi:hypothetical protein
VALSASRTVGKGVALRISIPSNRDMGFPGQPMAEIFGFPPENDKTEASRCRKLRLCPFGNKIPNCTKDKARDPLGVCSVNTSEGPVITCPIRFRENWQIAEEAAAFFFGEKTRWTSLTEVRLNDADGKSAGNIDVVLAAYDERGKVYDFGALEIQAVYISGNVRDPFERYMSLSSGSHMDWSKMPNYPRPDFLSSSRKRLAPQLLFKGGILHAWNKKMAVALDSAFFSTLPELKEIEKDKADIAWLVHDLVPDPQQGRFHLSLTKTVYTAFDEALRTITLPRVGALDRFVDFLQSKVDEKLDSPPDNQTLDASFLP